MSTYVPNTACWLETALSGRHQAMTSPSSPSANWSPPCGGSETRENTLRLRIWKPENRCAEQRPPLFELYTVTGFLMPPLQGWVKQFVDISLSRFEVKQPQDLWTLITQLIIPGFLCAPETYSIYLTLPWERWLPLSPWHSQWCKTSASVRFLHVEHNCLISIWKYSPDITTT